MSDLIQQLRERASRFVGFVDARGHAAICMREAANALEAANARIAELESRLAANGADSADAERLDFLILQDARVARSRDGDVWHVGRFEDAEGDLEWSRLGPTCDTPRQAIDAAIAASAAKGDKA